MPSLLQRKRLQRLSGYFCSQPNELSEQNVIKMIKSLAESEKGIYLVAERDGKIVGHAFCEPLHFHLTLSLDLYKSKNQLHLLFVILWVIYIWKPMN